MSLIMFHEALLREDYIINKAFTRPYWFGWLLGMFLCIVVRLPVMVLTDRIDHKCLSCIVQPSPTTWHGVVFHVFLFEHSSSLTKLLIWPESLFDRKERFISTIQLRNI